MKKMNVMKMLNVLVVLSVLGVGSVYADAKSQESNCTCSVSLLPTDDHLNGAWPVSRATLKVLYRNSVTGAVESAEIANFDVPHNRFADTAGPAVDDSLSGEALSRCEAVKKETKLCSNS